MLLVLTVELYVLAMLKLERSRAENTLVAASLTHKIRPQEITALFCESALWPTRVFLFIILRYLKDADPIACVLRDYFSDVTCKLF